MMMRNLIARWSMPVYALLVHLYPYSFRREFGASMRQVFRELVREASNEPGPAGLVRLWRRTLSDLAISLTDAYAREPRDLRFRALVALSLLFVCAIALADGYGAVRFGGFYDPPTFSRFSAAGADETTLLAAYEQALIGEFGQYQSFARSAGLVLAVLLGMASSVYGLWQRSLLHGAAMFLLGTTLTVAALSLLPPLWFPLDRYPVAAAWVMGGGLPLAGCVWFAVTALAWLDQSKRVSSADGP